MKTLLEKQRSLESMVKSMSDLKMNLQEEVKKCILSTEKNVLN